MNIYLFIIYLFKTPSHVKMLSTIYQNTKLQVYCLKNQSDFSQYPLHLTTY